MDAFGQLAHAPAVAREVVDDVFGHGLDRVRIEDHEVRVRARLEQPAVVDPGRLEILLERQVEEDVDRDDI